MSKLPTKILAIATLAIFILMAFSFTLVPSEGARSSFLIELADEENALKTVGNITGSQVSYALELSSGGANDGSTHKIEIEVVNDTYAGGSQASHWAFDFPDADSVSGDKATYYVDSGSSVTLACRVTFNSNTEGEKVSFTLDGEESAVGDPTPDNNFTYLSESGDRNGDIHEYLTVTAKAASDPFMEPSTAEDRQEKVITTDSIYSVEMINLGSKADQISITEITIWQDVNDNGIIDEGIGADDARNDYVEAIITTSTGAPYELGTALSFESMDSEEFNVELVPAKDNVKVPAGSYLVRLRIYSQTGDVTSECILKTYMPEITKPDFSITSLTLSSNDVEEDDSVTINAVIGIDWEYSGSVSYGFYVDNVLIGDKESFDFTESDTSKDVSTMWTAKTGSNDDRTIKIKVDLDNEFSEQDETNNEESETITVTTPEDGFPWWIVFVLIIGVAAAGAGYWWFIIAAGTGGELKVEEIILDTEDPMIGELISVKALIKNDGSTIKKDDEHTVLVSFYEDYEAIGDRTIDLTIDDFESGTIREVTFDWEPAASGLHALNVAVDLNEEENDVKSMDVEVKDY